MRGRIVRGIAGLYYVRCGDAAGEAGTSGVSGKQGDGLYECSAKGIFRREGKKPLVGDEVEIDVLDQDKLTGNIREILPRRSELIRPAAANVDQALVIFAILQPRPSFNLLDILSALTSWIWTKRGTGSGMRGYTGAAGIRFSSSAQGWGKEWKN